jgi:hypothetical protein
VNVGVDVEVCVGAESPALDLAPFDHVVEVRLEVPSGRLVVMGCTDYLPDAARTDVPPGWVPPPRAEAELGVGHRGGHRSDEFEEMMERIRIDVWPAAFAPVTVLKQWSV